MRASKWDWVCSQQVGDLCVIPTKGFSMLLRQWEYCSRVLFFPAWTVSYFHALLFVIRLKYFLIPQWVVTGYNTGWKNLCLIFRGGKTYMTVDSFHLTDLINYIVLFGSNFLQLTDSWVWFHFTENIHSFFHSWKLKIQSEYLTKMDAHVSDLSLNGIRM